VHLGVGQDGHTASLIPGDPVLDVHDLDVAITDPYEGRRRMTVTFPVLDRARSVLWFVTGAEKAEPLRRLLARDASTPAGRMRAAAQLLVVDRAAITGTSPRTERSMAGMLSQRDLDTALRRRLRGLRLAVVGQVEWAEFLRVPTFRARVRSST
jgi:hypothetical protein